MNTVIEQILKHKSIRHYQNKPIAEDILNDILTAASRAATTGNMQLYSIIVNQDEKMKQKIAPLHFNQPAIIEAPLILNCLLKHTLLVSNDDIRRTKIKKSLQTVITVDDTTIQIVKI